MEANMKAEKGTNKTVTEAAAMDATKESGNMTAQVSKDDAPQPSTKSKPRPRPVPRKKDKGKKKASPGGASENEDFNGTYIYSLTCSNDNDLPRSQIACKMKMIVCPFLETLALRPLLHRTLMIRLRVRTPNWSMVWLGD